MRKLRSSFLAIAILLGVTAGSFSLRPAAEAASLEQTTQTVSVVGVGEITVDPDIAYLNVGASTQNQSSQEALSQNAKILSKIQEVLQAKGIKKEDVKTIQFNSYPRYEWENNQNVLKGYQADHILRVATRDLDNLGNLMDALTAAGANRIENIQFDTEKTSEYEGKALNEAMGRALGKATVLANAAGKKIQGVVAVSEMGTNSTNPIYQPYMAMDKSATAASTPISQGTLTLTANITVVYSME